MSSLYLETSQRTTKFSQILFRVAICTTHCLQPPWFLQRNKELINPSSSPPCQSHQHTPDAFHLKQNIKHQTPKLLRPTQHPLTFFVDFFSLTSYLSLERSHSHDPGLMNCNHTPGSHHRSDRMTPFKPNTFRVTTSTNIPTPHITPFFHLHEGPSPHSLSSSSAVSATSRP